MPGATMHDMGHAMEAGWEYRLVGSASGLTVSRSYGLESGQVQTRAARSSQEWCHARFDEALER